MPPAGRHPTWWWPRSRPPGFRAPRTDRAPSVRIVLLALILMASACQRSSTDVTTTSMQANDTAATGEGDGTDAPSDGGQVDVPPISGLVAELPIVAPGEVAILTGSTYLSGELWLTGPGGAEVTAPFTEGSGSVDVPPGATEGEWQAVVTSDTGAIAVGSVEVATGPSLLMVADRNHVAPGGDVTVTLHAKGLPDDAQVIFGWGNIDWKAYFEDEETDGEEPLGVLIPDQNGVLQLGTTPVALSDVVATPLLMGGGLKIAGLQAMVFSTTSDEFFLSEPLQLEGCSTPVPIRGTIGGRGSVHLLSFGDGLRSAATVTTDGSFVVDAPHGPTVVFAALEDGGPLDPVSFDVPCAGIVELDFVSDSVKVEAPGAVVVVDADDFVAGEGGTLTLSGDQSATFPVEPVCQYRGDGIDVTFGTYDLDLPAVQLTVSGGEESGSHEGIVEITDWTDVTQSTGTVEVSIEYAADPVLANAVMSLDGDFAGAAGAGTIEGTFSCIVLGLTPPAGETASPEPEVDTAIDDLLVELPATVFDTPGPDASLPAAACRVIVVDDLGDLESGIRTAAALRTALSRATVVTLSEWHAVFGPDRQGQLLGPGRSSGIAYTVEAGAPVILVNNDIDGDDSSEAVAASVLLPDSPVVEESWVIRGPVADLPDALVRQVLCLDVAVIDVPSGETANLVLWATNLAGEPIAEADVVISESELGTIESSRGTLRSGEFEASFTGGEVPGEESLTVEVGGDEYPTGYVYLNVATGFAYTLEGQYRVELNPTDPNVPVPSGPLGATLVARSCTSRSGPWDGVLVLEAGPLLTMIELTGLAGATAASFLGTGVELQEASLLGPIAMPFPDIGLALLVAEGLSASPAFITAPVRQLIDRLGANQPYQPIVLPVGFTLASGGNKSVIEVNGESSGFTLKTRRGRRNEVQLKAGDQHLLKAIVSRVSACPTDAELSLRVEELVPDPPTE